MRKARGDTEDKAEFCRCSSHLILPVELLEDDRRPRTRLEDEKGDSQPTSMATGMSESIPIASGQKDRRSREVIANKIQGNPKGTVSNAEAAIYFAVSPKTIRAWKKGEVQSRSLREGAKRGTVSNESILLLEKRLNSKA